MVGARARPKGLGMGIYNCNNIITTRRLYPSVYSRINRVAIFKSWTRQMHQRSAEQLAARAEKTTGQQSAFDGNYIKSDSSSSRPTSPRASGPTAAVSDRRLAVYGSRV